MNLAATLAASHEHSLFNLPQGRRCLERSPALWAIGFELKDANGVAALHVVKEAASLNVRLPAL